MSDVITNTDVKRYFYIDYENVGHNGLNGIAKLSESDNVIIYYSSEHATMTFGAHRRINQSNANIEFILVNLPIKNAVDCKILFDIESIYKSNKLSEYFIVSHDTDYDKTIEFLKGKNIKIRRITELCQCNQPELNKKQATVKSVDNSDKRPQKNEEVHTVSASNSKTTDKRESQIRSLFGRKFKKSPYVENKEAIISILLNAKDKQSVNNELTRLIPSSSIPAIFKEYKDFIPSISSNKKVLKLSDDKKKREAQFRSVYGTYFKQGIYKEKREEIIKILVNSKTKQQVNNELCKIIPGNNVSKILKQLKQLLDNLPTK